MSRIPGHVQDQLEAAARDQQTAQRRLVDTRAWREKHSRPGSPLDRVVRRLNRRGLQGDLSYCIHVRGDAPQPLYVNVNMPDFVFCGSCFVTATTIWALAIQGTDEDRTCDLCRICVSDGLRPFSAQLGAVLVGGAFCDACHELSSE